LVINFYPFHLINLSFLLIFEKKHPPPFIQVLDRIIHQRHSQNS